MKKIIIILLSGILFFTCLFKGSFVYANNIEVDKITKAYDYPIKPGTKEWEELPSVIERRAACEIPQDILKRMTTSALVESVITYPFFIDTIGAFEDFEVGLKWVSTYFSGIDELLSRTDACECIRAYLDNEKAQYDILAERNLREKTLEQMRICCKYEGAEQLLQYIEEKANGNIDT